MDRELPNVTARSSIEECWNEYLKFVLPAMVGQKDSIAYKMMRCAFFAGHLHARRVLDLSSEIGPEAMAQALARQDTELATFITQLDLMMDKRGGG